MALAVPGFAQSDLTVGRQVTEAARTVVATELCGPVGYVVMPGAGAAVHKDYRETALARGVTGHRADQLYADGYDAEMDIVRGSPDDLAGLCDWAARQFPTLFQRAGYGPSSAPLVGTATTIDGDTLEIQGRRIRLWGIDAPEAEQTCARADGAYRCGDEARAYLARQVDYRTVFCVPTALPLGGDPVPARCSISLAGGQTAFEQGLDIAASMLVAGWAVKIPDVTGNSYAVEQASAQRGRRGLWSGEFQPPWEWRSDNP